MPNRINQSRCLPLQLPKLGRSKTAGPAKGTPAQTQTAGTGTSTESTAKETSTSLVEKTMTLGNPLSENLVGEAPAFDTDLSFPDAPEGAEIQSHTFQETFKTIGDPKTNGMAFGQVTAEEAHYAQWAPGSLDAEFKADTSAMAETAHGKQEWTTNHGDHVHQTEIDETFDTGTLLKTEAGAHFSLKDAKASANAKIEGRVGNQTSITVKRATKHFSAEGTAELNSGAWGKGTAELSLEPKSGNALAKAAVQGFAGAEQKVEGAVKAGWVTVKAGIGAQEGVGAEFTVGAGLENGRFNTDLKTSAAVGCGATVTCGVSLNTAAMAAKAKKAVSKALGRGSAATSNTLPAGPGKEPSSKPPTSTKTTVKTAVKNGKTNVRTSVKTLGATSAKTPTKTPTKTPAKTSA